MGKSLAVLTSSRRRRVRLPSEGMTRRHTHVLLAVLALLAVMVTGIALAAEQEDERTAPTARQTPAPEPEPLPDPDAALPRSASALAGSLTGASGRLDRAIDRWRSTGNPARGVAPRDVQLLALQEQRIIRLLTGRRRLSVAVLARLPRRLRGQTRNDVLARRELGLIHSVRRGPPPKVRVGRPPPADVLRRHYRAAWRRFGVGPPLLAAVNFVETGFGKLRNRSVSGAQGPMQFIPSTWAAYGMGGDIRNPRDAIMGAANYLHANGAPGDERRALYRYNPSTKYVSAVSRYTRRIRRDPRALYAYHAWQVFWGHRRLTDPPA